MVKYISRVDKERCNGDKRCERLCPAGAIRVVEAIAVVDPGRCVACGKCEDGCRERAVTIIPRSEPLLIQFDPAQVDEERIHEVCRKAHLYPDQFICVCTGTLVKEAVAAILCGARTPEDLTAMTGVRSGCGIYCMAPILRLFKAAGIEIPPSEDHKWYDLPLSLWDVPAKVAEKNPGYYLEEDKEVLFKEGE